MRPVGQTKRNAGEGRDAHFPVMSGTRRTVPRSRSARGRRAARPRLPVLHPLIPPDREPGPEILRLGLSFGLLPATVAERPGRASRLNRGVRRAEQLLLFANELRTRAKEILVLAVSTDDLEVRDMRRVIAAGYEKLARRIERRAREARETREAVEA